MVDRRSLLRRVLFALRGGTRLNGSADEATARGFHLLLSVFLGWMAVMTSLVVPGFAARRAGGEVLGFVLVAATTIALILVRRGRTRPAAYLFLIVYWCTMAVVAVLSGGVRSGGSYMTLVAIVGAAWLIDFPAAVAFGVATLLLTTAEAVLALTGHSPPVYFPVAPVAFWALSLTYVALTLGALAALLESERRHVAALRESEDRFHSLSDSTLQGIMIHDGGVILDCNQRFAQMFGYARPDELIGRNGPELLLTAESRARIVDRLSRDETGVVEITGIRKDGTTFPGETESRPIKHRGRDAHVVAMDDISERREKRALEAQLRRAQQMEALGRLTGGIAHDFNNLLTVINGYGDLLLAQMREGDPLQPAAKAVRGAGERAAELTNRLLMMSRPHAAEARPLDVSALLAENQDLHQRLLGETIVLEMDLAATGQVLIDAGHFLQVMMNLVANARDAMPDGGRLTVTTSRLQVRDLPATDAVGLGEGTIVRITVADTGSGIPPESIDRIFEPFYTTKAATKGTGLGLSIVDSLVRQNGGVVRVSSPPGRGAIFTLDFPELPQSRAAGTTATGARATASASGTEAVLVVEDQPEVRQLMIDTLTRAGFRVYSAAGPHEAIALAARHAGPLPLMVTDVIMPQMNGPALAERLTAVRPELRVLFVSGYTAQLPVMDGLGARARFLAKPFAPSTLVMTVRAMLDESIGVPS